MKQLKLFTKTSKDTPKDEVSLNSILLMRAGYIQKEMAGVYSYLPLGLRVLKKIENIIKAEINTIGVELLMPSIVPKKTWEITGRLDTIDVLMKTSPANAISKAKNDSEYILCPTHEDVVTPLVQKYARTYKDFPLAVYQIQTKFRNEPRAKSGLLRCREFRMKDLYSFHSSIEDFQIFYNSAKEVYKRIFQNLGLGDDTKIVLASGGDFTKDNSHEFQTRCEAGEDTVFYAKSIDIAYNKEIAPSQSPILEQDSIQKEKEEVLTENTSNITSLTNLLKVKAESVVKTILFETNDKRIIAAAIRGDYEINEEKLRQILKVDTLNLASEATVNEVTGAGIGYAGLLGLADNVELYIDDSIKGLINFVMGANKTNYHYININFTKDLDIPKSFYDFKIVKVGDINPESDEVYEVYKAVEVGNIFPLQTKFTDAFKYTYIDNNGKGQPIYMGSYGIGPSRVMGVLAENFNDENGLIWPKQVAPFEVHLVTLGKDDSVKEQAENLYKQALKQGIDILYDDRDISPGAKLADSDLIGIPCRVIISKRSLENNEAEVKMRNSKESELIKLDNILNHVA